MKIAPGGARQSLAIRNNGSLVLWGGVLPPPATPPPPGSVPSVVPPLPSLTGQVFVDAAMGLMHLVAIRAGDSIWAWGNFVSPGPVQPSFTVKANAVAAAAGHWIAIKASDQTLFQWPTPRPGAVAPPEGKFIKVSARNNYTIALRDDHRLFAWGGTAFPANGMPTSPGTKSGAVSGPIDLNIKTFLQDWEFDGKGHFFVHGRFDFPIPDVPQHIDVQPSGDMIVDIAAGAIQSNRGNVPHILALRADGKVTGWGPQSGAETKAPAGVKFKKIAAGLRYSVGIDDSGLLLIWAAAGALSSVPPGRFSSIGAATRHAAAVAAT